jgi:hypothetical protein
VWRQPCEDDPATLAVLLRATPIVGSPFVCYSNFTIIQDSQQVEAGLAQVPGLNSFCVSDLFVPTTVSLERRGGAPFDPNAAFALIVKGTAEVALNMPTAGPEPFGVAIVATGCTNCANGQLAQFLIRVTNPGPPFVAELKTAAHLPSGAAVTLLGRHVEEVIRSGQYDIPLVAVSVFELTPRGAYTVEAALLDPVTGVTLARASLQANVQ